MHCELARLGYRVGASTALDIEVHDDGTGGADPRGNRLRRLKDRVEALGGALQLDSPPDHGTRLRATLPLTEAYTG